MLLHRLLTAVWTVVVVVVVVVVVAVLQITAEEKIVVEAGP